MIDFGLLIKISGLAFADAINVCAFAILIMVLVTILIKNPDKPHLVLKTGLAFVFAVFIMYMIYAFILINILTAFTEKVRWISPYFYNGFAILAMIFGALNIKDYFIYQPGGIGTEMPLSIRPKLKLLIKKITSPIGAFFTGIFVTLFLLPCTMMPLIITANILSERGFGFIQSLPWFIYYNFIFVLPMLMIVLFIYIGFKSVDEISGWKERNVRKLHLLAGILLFGVGLALLGGWI